MTSFLDGNSGNAVEYRLADEAATNRLGQDLAMALRPGDLVLLCGELGAGKSTLARAMLRALAANPELEVPSPTYTLCQRYELQLVVSHFDLYRLAHPDELEELGLDEALESGVALIEWPQMAGNLLPQHAFKIELSDDAMGGRLALVSCGADHGAGNRFARSRNIREFLDGSMGETTERRFLQGDASSRRYETAHLGDATRILMDAPRKPDGPAIKDGKPYSRLAHLAEDVTPFIAIDETLRNAGYAAPQIFARSLDHGLLLIEHLGNEKIVDAENRPVPARYTSAAKLLASMHRHKWPATIEIAGDQGAATIHNVPRYSADALLIEASLLVDWYAKRATGKSVDEAGRAEFFAIWSELTGQIDGSMPTLVLRDYHSPNLIWREGETFPGNLGLIDFQDGVIGPQAYDLASLGQDARVDVSTGLEAEIVEAYLSDRRSENGFEEILLLRDYAILAAHRATKILGIFVRLDERDGKPGYLRHLPRMRDYLSRNLRHPALARYRQWCAKWTDIDG